MTELKNCPVCGEKPAGPYTVNLYNIGTTYCIECESNMDETIFYEHSIQCYGKTEKEVIDNWVKITGGTTT